MSTSILTFTKISQLLLSLAVIASGCAILFYFYQHFYTAPVIPSQTEIADVMITQPILTKTNEQGKKIIHFSSNTLWHYQKDNRSIFSAPIGYYYPEKSPPWKVIADRGEALRGDEIIYLNGHVKLHQDAGSRNHEMTITTDTMTIYPALKTAENNVFVTIEQPGLTVTSVGFFADLKQNKVKLLSKTKGFYSPANNSTENAGTQ